ncbi:formin-like protein 17 [Rhododendron vialii]|uniref:formin-like protein 17 n=1 Tax=Rhododendron vialii TaxID=182163 RepID=UPI00265FCF52|nr:formin-like protein 17 [Rhododendron vialii]
MEVPVTLSRTSLTSCPSPPPPPPPPIVSQLALTSVQGKGQQPSPSIDKSFTALPMPPPPPPFSGVAPLTTINKSLPPPPPPFVGVAPLPTINKSFPPPPPPPPPFSGVAPLPNIKKTFPTHPPPPPPLPPTSSSSPVQSPSIKNSFSTPPPPPPPLCPGPASSPSTISSALPPPPRPPSLALKDPLSRNSPHGPPLPPPPAPFTNGLSKTGGASRQSHAAGSNGNIPPIPGPPLSTKGRLPLRANSRNQDQSKKASLKPYHWLKLTRAMQGSLWAETQKSDEASKAPEFDMTELESLFAATIPTNGSTGGKSNRRGSGPKSDKVNLIDLRRAYNCEIMLTKVKVPLPDLMGSVLALDDSALDVDQVDNLIKFCPTKEEMELLKNYNGEKEILGKCEQFFLELMKVPRVESKLRVFSFKIQFRSQVSELRNNLNIVNSVADEIRNSAKLKRIMQTILSLGNALNHGTARGSAVGFRLDSLLKLTDTRAKNNKMTLMHYLCKVLAEKLPELLDFVTDLKSLEASTKIQLKYLAEEKQAVSKGIEKVLQELTASENDGPVSENFCKILKEFLGFAEAEVRSLAPLYSGVGRNADALALYFGEDPARTPFEQVVSTLLNFVRTFVRAHDENLKQIELEKKKAQKEAENENMKASTPKKGAETEKTKTSGSEKGIFK